MPLSDQEREEVVAVRDATTLHMLPIEAHIASVQWMAERLIDVDDERRQLQTDLDACLSNEAPEHG